jgi:hypothetical protein
MCLAFEVICGCDIIVCKYINIWNHFFD